MKEERRIPLLSRLAGKASGRGLSRSEYLSAVAEDVEELLNTRAPCREWGVAAGAGDGKMWLLLHPSVICERIPSLRRALSLLNEIKTIRAMRNFIKSITQI